MVGWFAPINEFTCQIMAHNVPPIFSCNLKQKIMITLTNNILEAQSWPDAYNSQLKQSDVSWLLFWARHLAYEWFDFRNGLHRCMEKYSKISLVEKDISRMYV